MAKYVRDFDDFYKKTRRIKLKDISDTEPITLGGCDFDTGADAKEMIKNVRQDKWSMRFWKIRKYTIRFFKFIFLKVLRNFYFYTYGHIPEFFDRHRRAIRFVLITLLMFIITLLLAYGLRNAH